MKAHEVIEKLRKYGKVHVRHNRKVAFYQCGQDRFLKDKNENLINIRNLHTNRQDILKLDPVPGFMTVTEFRENESLADFDHNNFFCNTGGYCTLRFEKDGVGYYSEAVCCAEDRYNKHIALEIAVGRLIKDHFPVIGTLIYGE